MSHVCRDFTTSDVLRTATRRVKITSSAPYKTTWTTTASVSALQFPPAMASRWRRTDVSSRCGVQNGSIGALRRIHFDIASRTRDRVLPVNVCVPHSGFHFASPSVALWEACDGGCIASIRAMLLGPGFPSRHSGGSIEALQERSDCRRVGRHDAGPRGTVMQSDRHAGRTESMMVSCAGREDMEERPWRRGHGGEAMEGTGSNCS